MKNYLTLIKLSLLCLLSTPIFAQQTLHVENKDDALDFFMNYCHEIGVFNGTVLVAENGKTIYRGAFGIANKENNQPLKPETQFYLASVSKQFTAMAIMLLKEKGKLSYDDKLSQYFPEFPEYAKEVTIRQMMHHTSGVANHYNLGIYKPGLSNEDVLQTLIRQKALDFKPGEKYSYSNGAYVLLAMTVERITKMPFSQFMKENIFDPLKMDNTLVFDKNTAPLKNRAIGYSPTGELDDYNIYTTGAGGMFSNVDDLLKWDQALYTEKLLPQASLEEAYKSASLNNGEQTGYGFGWGIERINGEKVVGHSGGLAGFRTFIRRYLGEKNAYILLTNYGDGVAMNPVRAGIENILAGNDYTLPKQPLSNFLTRALPKTSFENAVKETLNAWQTEPDNYENDENAINALGYQFMGNKEVDKALAIFKLNLDLNPNSFNVYDSYGEGLLAKGDTTNAISNYKKSMELNPRNDNGIKVLKGLGLQESDFMSEVKVSEEVLEMYVGKYELTPGFILDISREGTQLFIFPTGQIKSKIFPATENRFYSKIVDAQITFNKDDEGKINSLTLHQGGNFPAKRLDD